MGFSCPAAETVTSGAAGTLPLACSISAKQVVVEDYWN